MCCLLNIFEPKINTEFEVYVLKEKSQREDRHLYKTQTHIIQKCKIRAFKIIGFPWNSLHGAACH